VGRAGCARPGRWPGGQWAGRQVASRFRPAGLVAGLEVHGHLNGEFARLRVCKSATCRYSGRWQICKRVVVGTEAMGEAREANGELDGSRPGGGGWRSGIVRQVGHFAGIGVLAGAVNRKFSAGDGGGVRVPLSGSWSARAWPTRPCGLGRAGRRTGGRCGATALAPRAAAGIGAGAGGPGLGGASSKGAGCRGGRR
jgi:hypothetical protein